MGVAGLSWQKETGQASAASAFLAVRKTSMLGNKISDQMPRDEKLD